MTNAMSMSMQMNPDGSYVGDEAPPPSMAKYLLAMGIGIGVALVVGLLAISLIHAVRNSSAVPEPVPAVVQPIARPPSPPPTSEPIAAAPPVPATPDPVKPPPPPPEVKKPDVKQPDPPRPRPHVGPTRLP